LGGRCKPHVPVAAAGKPDLYFSYECAFEGLTEEHTESHVVTSYYTTSSWVPGTHHSYTTGSSSYYYYQSNYELSEYYHSQYSNHSWHTPGYYSTSTHHQDSVVTTRSCVVNGQVNLTGIDPVIEGDVAPTLMASANEWETIVAPYQANPEEFMLGLCFSHRATIQQVLFNQSRCVINQDDAGAWKWELWGVHPYHGPFAN
jgi:hypothetical protein